MLTSERTPKSYECVTYNTTLLFHICNQTEVMAQEKWIPPFILLKMALESINTISKLNNLAQVTEEAGEKQTELGTKLMVEIGRAHV